MLPRDIWPQVENQREADQAEAERRAMNATSIAVVNIAMTTSERRLAIRRLCADIWVTCTWASTSRSNTL